MKDKIAQLIKENLDFWLDDKSKELTVDVDSAAEKIESWIKDEDIYEGVKKVVGDVGIKDLSDVSFKEDCDREEWEVGYHIEEGMTEKEATEAVRIIIYNAGFHSGYEKCYETITGKHYGYV